MPSKVALVRFEKTPEKAFIDAVKLIGGLGDLNHRERAVTIKVGIFDHRTDTHSTAEIVSSISKAFDKAPQVMVVESDNYRGTGSERLQKWTSIYDGKVTPFNLSEDTETRKVKIADEDIQLSHVLFKPNVFVSTHVLRTFEKGSILKNLLGLIPDRK